jgi:hypothetical protein
MEEAVEEENQGQRGNQANQKGLVDFKAFDEKSFQKVRLGFGVVLVLVLLFSPFLPFFFLYP